MGKLSMGETRGRSLLLGAALVLFATSLAGLLLMHPNTPYKAFLRGTAPVVGLWLVIGAALGWHRDATRMRLILALTAAAAWLLAALWCLKPEWLAATPVARTATAMSGRTIGLWLAALLIAAAASGAFNRYYRLGPMSALACAAIAYALLSGFVPLPFGPELMTVGMLWLGLWQAVYLWQARGS
jgi:hypothetical protein